MIGKGLHGGNDACGFPDHSNGGGDPYAGGSDVEGDGGWLHTD